MTLSNEGQHQHVEPSGQDPEGADDHKAVPHGGPILQLGWAEMQAAICSPA